MSYTLGQAAKATGVSKMTIQRAIKSGKISADKHESGSYTIQPVELHRIFPPVSSDSNDMGSMLQKEPLGDTPKRPRETVSSAMDTAVLEERLRGREDKIRDLEQRIRDIESERDQWSAQAKQLTLLLAAPKPASVETPVKEPWYKRRLW